MAAMTPDIVAFNASQATNHRSVCEGLAQAIARALPEAEAKVWHGSPVWFLERNPIVGYSVKQDHVELLFWSGQSFDEPKLEAQGKFKAAGFRLSGRDSPNERDLRRWLRKARRIQWDYENLAKRRGVLEKRGEF